MNIIDIPTEQSTAFTDILLAALSFGIAMYLRRIADKKLLVKSRIWSWAFRLLGIGSLIAVVAHGLQMSAETNDILWQPINLSLGLMISLIVVGVIYDIKGFLPRGIMPAMLGLGVIFYAVTLAIPGQFIVFVIYEAIAMLFALVTYIIMALRRSLKGAWLMASGIFISMLAAAIQATGSIHFTLIWEFDHNGVFHIVQMVGMGMLFAGLRGHLMLSGGSASELQAPE